MFVRLEESKSPIIPNTNASRPTTAIAVMTNVTFSASPTPIRCTPTKTA